MAENNEAARLLVSEIAVRMRSWLDRALACLDQLEEGHMWHRPNASSNAIGNLILHLVGNLRQWILGGIGNQPDTRNRPAEFSATSGHTKNELRTLLKEVVEDSCKVIENMPANRVLERKVIQGKEVTIGMALVNVMSHLSLHVGQMQYITKMVLSDKYQESWKPKEETNR